MTKTSIFDLYETDDNAEEDGKWFSEFGPEIQLKLRRFSSAKSRKVRDSLFKGPLKVYKTAEKIPTSLSEELTARHLAEGIVVDWKGVYDRDGNEIPFSPDRAADLFLKLKDFATEVILVAVNMDNFRKEKVDEIVGN